MTGSDVAGNPVIMTDDPLLNTPGNRFAALAWNYVYSFDTVDVAALKCFIRQHVSWGLTGYVNGGTQ